MSIKILRDFFFPNQVVLPVPAASTAFLKQACLLVKPNEGGTNGQITLCTTMLQVAAVTDNEEAQHLFNAGMTRVYILQMSSADLASALDGVQDFYTLIVSSDFSDEEIGQDVETPAVAAAVVIGDLTFTAKHAGLLGNDISVELIDDAELGEEIAHAVDGLITIHISDGNSTCTQIKAAVDDSVSASALVDVAIAMGQDAVGQDAASEVPLEGGLATVFTDGTGLLLGTWEGVTGVSSDDDEFLQVQVNIANRVGFHSTTSNKAQNMCYAFGKLLSVASDWLNQQYITMPLADDVDTLGEAVNLFDERISFVIEDAEDGNRLAFFSANKRAIVAPYIIKNLIVDIQSKGLQYVSGNMPSYTLKHAALLEDELKSVIQSYVDRAWIVSGSISITLVEDNFVANSLINVPDPRALWRVNGLVRES